MSSSSVLRSLLVVGLLSAPASAQDPTAAVPSSPNASCPIMGKKASATLFVDTELGRVWVCCKPCFKKVLADVPTAHKTAYPVVHDAKNTQCPVTGTQLGEHAVELVLQNQRFKVCCSECATRAKADSQPTLAKLLDAKVREVGNATCPVRGTAVAANHFVVIDQQLVRLADGKAVDAAKADPAGTLAKAQAIAKSQPPTAPHTPKPAQPAPSAPKADGKESK